MTPGGNTRITPSNFMKPKVGSSSQLVILRQHSLEVDHFVENGQPKSVHYVVKNSAFVLEVALKNVDWTSNAFSGISPLKEIESPDFNKITLETCLLYDCRDEKEVACVKVQPLTYRGVVKKSNPSVCFLEATIKVLSSQHEDMNFKLKFIAVDSSTKLPIPEIAPAYSEPIQVISKPEVLKKKNQPKATAPRKNKPKSELILETLSRIEATQALQQKQIDLLLSERGPKKLFAEKSVSKLCGKRPLHDSSRNLGFAYQQFISAVRNVTPEERPSKLRKLYDLSSEVEQQTWNSIIASSVKNDKDSALSQVLSCPPVPPPTYSPEPQNLFDLNSEEFLSNLGF